MLKEAKHFTKIVSHFDVAPTVVAYYKNNYNLKTPTNVTWVGKGLIADSDVTLSGIPMMKSKNLLINYQYGSYHLEDDQLFMLKNMQENPIEDEALKNKIKKQFNAFKSKNDKFYQSNMLMPDSVMTNFLKKK